MIKRTITILSILLLLTSLTSNVYADAICKDGWRSKSSGSGTCSWHGGVLNWLPKAGSSSSYGRDSYYDNSDNGVYRCKYRRYRESEKECEMRIDAGYEANEYLKNRGSLGKTREELLLEKWNKEFTKEMKKIDEYSNY